MGENKREFFFNVGFWEVFLLKVVLDRFFSFIYIFVKSEIWFCLDVMNLEKRRSNR